MQDNDPLRVQIEHTLSNEQLEAFRQPVLQTFLEALEEAKRAVGMKQLLNKKEACEFLSCSPQQLEQFMRDGMQCHRLGKRTYYFDREEIIAFIKKF